MKKYSDKFLNQSNKLKFARVGFEFEFYMKDLSYYKTLELLNIELSPVKMWGFRQYHSDFKPDEKNFKIEWHKNYTDKTIKENEELNKEINTLKDKYSWSIL